MMWVQRAAPIVLGLTVALASTPDLAAQAASPLTGTWKLNVAKSTYDPANLAPKSGTSKYEVTSDAITNVTDGVDAQGRATHAEYTAKLDGKDSPYKGTIGGDPNPQDAVSVTKVDDHTFVITNKMKGKALTTIRIVVAPDGKTRTVTTTGANAQGVTVHNTALYEKQ